MTMIKRSAKLVSGKDKIKNQLNRIRTISSQTDEKVKKHKNAIFKLLKEKDEIEKLNEQRKAEAKRLEMIMFDQGKKVEEAKKLIETASLIIQQEKDIENKIKNSEELLGVIDKLPKIIIELEQRMAEARQQNENENAIRLGAINTFDSNVQELKNMVSNEKISELKQTIKKENESYNSHLKLINQINEKVGDLNTLTVESSHLIPILINEDQFKKTSTWGLVAIGAGVVALTAIGLYTDVAIKIMDFIKNLPLK